MTKTVQIVGPRGMLGTALKRALLADARYRIYPSDLDILSCQMEQITADVVVNCAGIVKQHHARPEIYMQVNGAGPHRLAEVCWRAGARVIHISTDCVFWEPGPHSESELPRPSADAYSRSKLAGELSNPHITIRTSFIGTGVRGLLRDLYAQDVVTASNNLLWSGHTVDTVARSIIDVIDRINDIPGGILHIPGEFQSRWELVQRLSREFDIEAHIIRDDSFTADRRLEAVHWALYGLPTPPPFSSQLETMWRAW